MIDNLRLEKLTVEELKNLPKTKVTYFYVRKNNTPEIKALIKLDSLLAVEFSLSEKDIILLMQEHKLSSFNQKEEFVKEYHLTKGWYQKGSRKGRDWYRVDLLVVPGVIIKKFLDNKSILYVKKSKNLDKLFIEHVN